MKKFVLLLACLPSLAQALNIDVKSTSTSVQKVISLSGEIVRGDANSFKSTIESLAEKELLLQLNSPGGSVYEGELLVEQIRELKSHGVKIITEVKNGEQCGSMCVALFLTGDVRRAAEVSAFYFHGVMPNAFCLLVDEKSTKDYVSLLVSLGMDTRFKKYLEDQGVFASTSKFWLSGRELFQLGHGFVSQIETRHVKNGDSCLTRWSDRPR